MLLPLVLGFNIPDDPGATQGSVEPWPLTETTDNSSCFPLHPRLHAFTHAITLPAVCLTVPPAWKEVSGSHLHYPLAVAEPPS